MKIRNIIGRLKGYSGCKRCGDTWDYKEEHDTKFLEGRGCFPLCQECWESLLRSERLPYYRQLWEEWGEINEANWHEIENAVMNGR